MTSLHWQTSLQNRQCHALCMLGKTSKCRLGLSLFGYNKLGIRQFVFEAYMAHRPKQASVDLASDLFVYYRLGMSQFVFGAYTSIDGAQVGIKHTCSM